MLPLVKSEKSNEFSLLAANVNLININPGAHSLLFTATSRSAGGPGRKYEAFR